MTPDRVYSVSSAGSYGVVRNRVLRNTYWLLALSLLPTVLGAWLGLSLNLRAVMGGSPVVTGLLFLAGAFGFIFAIERFKNSGIGVALLLGFTFFMGLMLSRILGFVLGMQNGPMLVGLAFGGTAGIFAVMATIATVSKRDFTGMGKWLFAGALAILIVGVANLFLQLPALMLALSALAVVLFSVFMLYDVQRIVNGGETNYVSATLALYLDIYNVFTNLLALIGIGNSSD
jgi:modulator of FtsH protease